MRLLAWIVGGLVALALLRMAAAIIVAVIVLATVVALIRAPKETLAVLGGLLLMNAFAAHPGLGICLMIAILIAGGWAHR